MTPPINIDGTQITGASIDGTDVSQITVDGTQVFAASAIPPGAVAQYQIVQRSTNAIVDQLNNFSDATVFSTNNISGTFSGGFAEEAVNAADRFEIPQQAFENTTELTLFFTLADYTGTSSQQGFGQSGAGGNNFVGFFNFSTSGDLRMFTEDGSGAGTDFRTSNGEGLNDGNKHRIAIAIPPSNANSPKIGVDGSTVPVTVSSNQANKTSFDFPADFGILNESSASNSFGNGDGLVAIADNVIVSHQFESDSIIQQDFNNQPWS